MCSPRFDSGRLGILPHGGSIKWSLNSLNRHSSQQLRYSHSMRIKIGSFMPSACVGTITSYVLIGTLIPILRNMRSFSTKPQFRMRVEENPYQAHRTKPLEWKPSYPEGKKESLKFLIPIENNFLASLSSFLHSPTYTP